MMKYRSVAVDTGYNCSFPINIKVFSSSDLSFFTLFRCYDSGAPILHIRRTCYTILCGKGNMHILWLWYTQKHTVENLSLSGYCGWKICALPVSHNMAIASTEMMVQNKLPQHVRQECWKYNAWKGLLSTLRPLCYVCFMGMTVVWW